MANRSDRIKMRHSNILMANTSTYLAADLDATGRSRGKWVFYNFTWTGCPDRRLTSLSMKLVNLFHISLFFNESVLPLISGIVLNHYKLCLNQEAWVISRQMLSWDLIDNNSSHGHRTKARLFALVCVAFFHNDGQKHLYRNTFWLE